MQPDTRGIFTLVTTSIDNIGDTYELCSDLRPHFIMEVLAQAPAPERLQQRVVSSD